MRATVQIAEPDKAEMQVSIAMSVADWKLVAADLHAGKAWSSARFAECIASAIAKTIEHVELAREVNA